MYILAALQLLSSCGPYLEPLQGLLLCDSDVGLFQGNWSEAVVEVEQALGRVDTQEGGHILQRRRRRRRSRRRRREEEESGEENNQTVHVHRIRVHPETGTDLIVG